MRSPQEAFRAYYGAMPDEELLHVAENEESLVPDARAALADELRKRGIKPPTPVAPGPKSAKRHGCLTVYLACLLILSVLGALLFALADIRQFFPSAPRWTGPVYVLFSALQSVLAIALFRWKKWAFWGLCITFLIGVAINLAVGMGAQSIAGLLGVAVLYGVLRIGGENDGWSQLR
jgi:hypothetical protein